MAARDIIVILKNADTGEYVYSFGISTKITRSKKKAIEEAIKSYKKNKEYFQPGVDFVTEVDM